MKRRYGLPRDAIHLQSTLYPLCIIGLQTGCGYGVNFSQFAMHARPAKLSGFLLQFGPNLCIRRRHVVQAVKQCFEIQHRAAHQQRQMTASGDFYYQTRGVFDKFSGRVGLQRVANIDQMVRHTG